MSVSLFYESGLANSAFGFRVTRSSAVQLLRLCPVFHAGHVCSSVVGSGVYAEFNAKGKCSFGARCKYRHNCADCGGSSGAG